MKFIQTEISGCVVIEPAVHGDKRGCFVELHHRQKYSDFGINALFVQDNFSRSCQNTLRGLHYQIEQPQGKLVWAVRGEIYDVLVDLRRGSSTFGKSLGVRLSEDNFRQLYAPPGMAHGFCVLSESADVFYKCTDYYAPQHERTLRWNDPALAIEWPVERPILSEKDQHGVLLENAETYP